ncbi:MULTISPECIES: hypothetical protein [unclassified Leifsonia]|uniref:hypothetical protein n=1 Tax=unclassified Leifsonia TaxID=2663824 RepID=UPI0008A7946F|nr:MULTISPECIES: hypothetical protein [unclassified Leifsonia]SEH84104.1 hypothetical protein SAMN04515694_10538 [Leifsonia sp. CL154]SFL46768.1 hypothetical protein SAMN04515692_10537 [Leifsonia sp. CL147]
MNLADTATFDPAALGAAFSAGVPQILLWLGAAVAAAIAGSLVFIGIRKGVGWGVLLLSGYRYDRNTGGWNYRGDRHGSVLIADGLDDHYGNAGIEDDLRRDGLI